MIAGVPGDPSNLLRGGHASLVADSYAAAHGGWAPILVFPDHNGGMWKDTECVDGPRGNAETYLTVDVPRFVADTFGAALGGPTWGILGYSEGGTCAMTLALRHPELFSSFVDIGGDLRPSARTSHEPRQRTVAHLYGGHQQEWERHEPLRLLARRPDVDATFVVGTCDRRARSAAGQLDTAALASGVRSRVITVRGGHSFAMVARAIAAALPDLSSRLLAAAAIPDAQPI
jgi:S-formylglutathione hydrolase FrmB